MNKIGIFLLIGLMSFNISYSQNDAAAKKILDAVSAKLKSFKGITASFTLKTLNSKGKAIGTKSGTMTSKGQKYVLKQAKTEIMCDGVKIYNFDGNKTVTISTVEESNQTLNPQNLFSNFYDKDFTYKLIGTKDGFDEIELKPIDKRKNFIKVNVFIDKAKSMITKAKILDKSNNTLELSLSNVNTAASIEEKLFVFDKKRYPTGVEFLD